LDGHHQPSSISFLPPIGLANNKNVSAHSSLWLKYVLLEMNVRKINIKENPNLGEFTNAFRKTIFM
jgi:hypothetical protein